MAATTRCLERAISKLPGTKSFATEDTEKKHEVTESVMGETDARGSGAYRNSEEVQRLAGGVTLGAVVESLDGIWRLAPPHARHKVQAQLLAHSTTIQVIVS
jgi:hypothetical protein